MRDALRHGPLLGMLALLLVQGCLLWRTVRRRRADRARGLRPPP